MEGRMFPHKFVTTSRWLNMQDRSSFPWWPYDWGWL